MSEKGKPGVVLYFDFWHGLKKLSLEDKGTLVDAMVRYSETGEEPELDGVLAVLWDLAKIRADADTERYSARCERQRENAMKRWSKSADAMACDGINGNANNANDAKYKYNSNTNAKTNIESRADKPPRTRFLPPTVEEVADYCRERRNTVDPQRFVSYYSAIGWMVGKNKMKDWKAAVRTWEQRDEERGVKSGRTNDKAIDQSGKFAELAIAGSNW